MNHLTPAFGISSLAHVVGLMILALLTWGSFEAETSMVVEGVLPRNLESLQPPSVVQALEERPSVPSLVGDPDLKGRLGDEASKEDRHSPMPSDFPKGLLDQSAGGEVPGGLGGDPESLSSDNPLMEVALLEGGRGMRVPRGYGKGTGTGRHNPFGLRGGVEGTGPSARIGKPRAEALALALDWLARHQDASGAWTTGFSARCRDACCAGGPASADYDTGLTALAALAFLGAGESLEQGQHKAQLRRAVEWLRARQNRDGSVGDMSREKAMYSHAIATMALAEVYGTEAALGTPSLALKDAAQRAVDYLLAAQNSGAAWRYRNYNAAGTPGEEGGNSDTSVMGWAILALKDARTAGLVVPDAAFKQATAWLDAVEQKDPATYRVTYGYTGASKFVFKAPQTTTAVGMLCRLLMGQAADGAESILLEEKPSAKKANLYYWYYGTLAMFQKGGASWTEWNLALTPALLEGQCRSGCARGSWDPQNDTWGSEGGRVYTTAIGALCLEGAVRYYRVTSDAK